VPNTQIAIQNVATGVTREVATNADGFYVAPNLLPGDYKVTASARGFQTQVQEGITLTVGAQQVLNITMQVGQVNTKVEVNAAEPTVELATSSLGAVVNPNTVEQLPLNGRSWTDLAELQPGVAGSTDLQYAYTTGSERGVRGFGDQISVSGDRPQWNNYRLDGISINDYSNTAGSVIGGNLGVDAIQEFSVLTSNAPAEYGRTGGGVVNAVTRSGTNEFHGGVYEFFRNSALDARNYFDPLAIPPFRRNQFGADGGGPIRKNKLFIFGDYEGIRQSQSVSSIETVPSAAARVGQLCSQPSSPSACTPHTIAVDPLVQKYLPFWPLPDNGILPSSNGDIGEWTSVQGQVVDENFFTTRVDYAISGKDTLSGTYLYDFAHFTTASPLNAVTYGTVTNRQVVALEETHIFSASWVNSARFGYSREAGSLNTPVAAINPLAADPSLGAIPGSNAPEIQVRGLTLFSGGLGAASSGQHFWNDYQVSDDAFWTHGTHSVKFGGAIERMQDNERTFQTGGIFQFSTLSNFLSNIPSKFSNRTDQSLHQGFRQTLYALYVQDDWRLRSNLTLNLGLRYETISVPTEVHNQLATLLTLSDPTPHLGSPLYSNPTHLNFEPRVGFAWDPFRDGKTAVRGGFGIFDVLSLPIELINTENKAYPFARGVATNKLPPGSFPYEAYSLSQPSSATEVYFQQNHPRSYVMVYNLNVQRQLPGGVTATVGYVGLHGVDLLFRSDDADTVIPTLTPAGFLFPSPVGSGKKINPNFGQVLTLVYNESSDYNALQVGIQKALSHGLQVHGSFTWGKSFDSDSSTGSGDQFTNAATASIPLFDMAGMRSLSDFNVTRNLVINALWQIPSPKSLPQPAEWLTHGWGIGAIYTASDGPPFSGTFGTNGDPLGMNSSSPVDFPNRLRGPGCQSLVNPGNPTQYVKTQCFAIPTAPSQAFYTANCDPKFGVYPQCFNLMGKASRNIMIGPGLSNLDFSIYKNNYIGRISERFNVQFRAEIFNIFNHTNFSFPSDSDIFLANGSLDPAAGLLTSTSTSSRQIQFALKIMW
jgi:outer membrane receptor protein involved in Fe transport